LSFLFRFFPYIFLSVFLSFLFLHLSLLTFSLSVFLSFLFLHLSLLTFFSRSFYLFSFSIFHYFSIFTLGVSHHGTGRTTKFLKKFFFRKKRKKYWSRCLITNTRSV
jgi:hypothetical protein